MKRNILYSLIIILTFLLALYGDNLILKFYKINLDTAGEKLIWSYGWWIIPVILITGLLFGFKNIIKELGLNRRILQAFILAAFCVSPMFISSALTGTLNEELSLTDKLNRIVFSGFFEEVLFRAFLFGLLFQRLQWGFIPASILGALVFGLGHLYQGSSFSESLGIFTVTFLGGLWFAWLFIEWKANLWVPVFFHMFMNLSWVIFDVDETALGGTYSNLFRIITIALSIIITIYYNKKNDKFRITDKNFFVNK